MALDTDELSVLVHLINWGSLSISTDHVSETGYLQTLFGSDRTARHEAYRFTFQCFCSLILRRDVHIVLHASEFFYCYDNPSLRYQHLGSLAKWCVIARDVVNSLGKVAMARLLAWRHPSFAVVHEIRDKSDQTILNHLLPTQPPSRSSLGMVVTLSGAAAGRVFWNLGCRLQRFHFNSFKRLVVHNQELKIYLSSILNVTKPIEYVPHYNYNFLYAPMLHLDVKGRRELCFVYFGALRPVKGVGDLLVAWASLLQYYKQSSLSLRLYILGDLQCAHNCSDRAAFERSIREGIDASVSSIVWIEKNLSDIDAVSIIQKCHCGVLPFLEGTTSGSFHYLLSARIPLVVSNSMCFFPYREQPGVFQFPAGSVSHLCSSLHQVCELYLRHGADYLKTLGERSYQEICRGNEPAAISDRLLQVFRQED